MFLSVVGKSKNSRVVSLEAFSMISEWVRQNVHVTDGVSELEFRMIDDHIIDMILTYTIPKGILFIDLVKLFKACQFLKISTFMHLVQLRLAEILRGKTASEIEMLFLSKN